MSKPKRDMLRRDLDGLLRDTTLTTLAFAIAFGWTLFQVASGLGYLITTAFHRFGSDGDQVGYYVGGLVWKLGGHAFVFEPLLHGLLEFAVVLAVFLLVPRSSRRV